MVPSTVGPVGDGAAAWIIRRFCAIGVHPDCWKLAPFRTEAAWGAAVSAIEEHDPHTRGIMALGLDAPESQGGLVTAALIVASNVALHEQRIASHVGSAVVHARNLEIAEALNASLIAEDRRQIWGAERKLRSCLTLLFERGVLVAAVLRLNRRHLCQRLADGAGDVSFSRLHAATGAAAGVSRRRV